MRRPTLVAAILAALTAALLQPLPARADPAADPPGAAPAAAPVEESAAHGWRALRDGDFETAEFLFRSRLRKTPDDPSAHAGLGVAWARQGKYDRALPELRRAQVLKSTFGDLDLELGRALFFQHRYAEAVPRLEAYRAARPEVWQVHEVLGLCYLHTLDFDGCIAALNHPALAPRTEQHPMHRFTIALAWRAKGDEARARELWSAVTRDFPGTTFAMNSAEMLAAPAPGAPAPGDVAMSQDGVNVGTDLWAEARRRRPDKWWQVHSTAEVNYDTNPVSIGSDALVEGSLARQPTWNLAGTVGATARILGSDRALWAVEARHLATWHDGIARFDQNQTTVSTYAEFWPLARVGLALDGAFSTLDVGHEKVLDSWSAGVGLLFVEAFWTRSRLWYQHGNQEYFLAELTAAQDFDSAGDTVGIGQEAYVPGTRLRVAAGYSHEVRRADGDDNDADFDRVYLQVAHPVAWEVRATAGVSWSFGSYHHGNSRDAAARERADDTVAASLRVERPMSDWLTAFVSATLINADSNLGVYEFDRNIYAAGIEIRY